MLYWVHGELLPCVLEKIVVEFKTMIAFDGCVAIKHALLKSGHHQHHHLPGVMSVLEGDPAWCDSISESVQRQCLQICKANRRGIHNVTVKLGIFDTILFVSSPFPFRPAVLAANGLPFVRLGKQSTVLMLQIGRMILLSIW